MNRFLRKQTDKSIQLEQEWRPAQTEKPDLGPPPDDETEWTDQEDDVLLPPDVG